LANTYTSWGFYQTFFPGKELEARNDLKERAEATVSNTVEANISHKIISDFNKLKTKVTESLNSRSHDSIPLSQIKQIVNGEANRDDLFNIHL
jgi:hypothetical protein